MTATTITVPQPATAICATCAKTFIRPTIASDWGGDATTCRACAADKIAAKHRRSIDAYIAVNATGIVHA